jgi:ABC-type antimicrobial peptide transport system permease subunit
VHLYRSCRSGLQSGYWRTPQTVWHALERPRSRCNYRLTLCPTQRTLAAGLIGSFGLIAALLAAIGLYGVMAYTVTRRTSEIGIRIALGAGYNDVLWMVLRGSLFLVAIGIGIGAPTALALTQVVREALYGIAPNDPVSFVAASVLMLAVATVAAWIPALRAARVDPMQALRHE